MRLVNSRHYDKTSHIIITFQSQLDHVLSAEAASKSVSKHYTEEIPELMDCLDLTYHHHIKNLVTVYNNYRETMKVGLERHMCDLAQACTSLDARRDKEQFLQVHESLFTEPAPFKYELNREFQSSAEVIN